MLLLCELLSAGIRTFPVILTGGFLLLRHDDDKGLGLNKTKKVKVLLNNQQITTLPNVSSQGKKISWVLYRKIYPLKCNGSGYLCSALISLKIKWIQLAFNFSLSFYRYACSVHYSTFPLIKSSLSNWFN